MAAGGAKVRGHFTGHQTIATVDALEAWVRSAEAGAKFTYCEALEPLRVDAWLRVPQLEQADLVHMRQERREGGGFRWYVVRTAKPVPTPSSPAERALEDPASRLIFAQLKREALLGLKCSSDVDLASISGLRGRDAAQWRVRVLVRAGLIESEIVTLGGVPKRVVTICAGPFAGDAGGKSTLAPGEEPRGAGRPTGFTNPRKRSGAL